MRMGAKWRKPILADAGLVQENEWIDLVQSVTSAWVVHIDCSNKTRQRAGDSCGNDGLNGSAHEWRVPLRNHESRVTMDRAWFDLDLGINIPSKADLSLGALARHAMFDGSRPPERSLFSTGRMKCPSESKPIAMTMGVTSRFRDKLW